MSLVFKLTSAQEALFQATAATCPGVDINLQRKWFIEGVLATQTNSHPSKTVIVIFPPLFQSQPQSGPLFSKVSAAEKKEYELFFEKTNEVNVVKYADGESLTALISLAQKVIEVTEKCNPIWDTYYGRAASRDETIRGRQWQIDRISEVKQRLAIAIEQKRAYYENTTWGKITKAILQCLCMWDNGNTSALIKAEDFLLRWDSRISIKKWPRISGDYLNCLFFPGSAGCDWVRENLNTRNFYNYNPARTIRIKDPFPGHVLPPNFVKI